jgi:hypothetical protein
VASIARGKFGILHPKLTQVLHRDFADRSALAEASPVKTRWSFAWARIPERYRTRSLHVVLLLICDFKFRLGYAEQTSHFLFL